MQKNNKILFFSILISLLLGISILFINGLIIYQYQWKPLQISIPEQAGISSQAEFDAQLGQRYEIELEFSSTLPEYKLINLLTQKEGIPSFSVTWKVLSLNKLIAQGNSQNLLYHSSGGRSLLGQIKRLLFSNPFHTGQGSAVRGIGQFTAKQNQNYQVQLTVNAVNKQLFITHPQLNVRPSRLVWQRHSQYRLLFAYTGFGLLIVGCVLFAIKILFTFRQRNKDNAPSTLV